MVPYILFQHKLESTGKLGTGKPSYTSIEKSRENTSQPPLKDTHVCRFSEYLPNFFASPFWCMVLLQQTFMQDYT